MPLAHSTNGVAHNVGKALPTGPFMVSWLNSETGKVGCSATDHSLKEACRTAAHWAKQPGVEVTVLDGESKKVDWKALNKQLSKPYEEADDTDQPAKEERPKRTPPPSATPADTTPASTTPKPAKKLGRGKGTSLPAEERPKIIARYQAGESQPSIAESYGVSLSQINRIVSMALGPQRGKRKKANRKPKAATSAAPVKTSKAKPQTHVVTVNARDCGYSGAELSAMLEGVAERLVEVLGDNAMARIDHLHLAEFYTPGAANLLVLAVEGVDRG